eukprot:4127203-Amphidinium_carterae.1
MAAMAPVARAFLLTQLDPHVYCAQPIVVNMANARRVPPLNLSPLALQAGGEEADPLVLGFSPRSCGSSTYWWGSYRSNTTSSDMTPTTFQPEAAAAGGNLPGVGVVREEALTHQDGVAEGGNLPGVVTHQDGVAEEASVSHTSRSSTPSSSSTPRSHHLAWSRAEAADDGDDFYGSYGDSEADEEDDGSEWGSEPCEPSSSTAAYVYIGPFREQ